MRANGDYYQVLGVGPGASQEVITEAYRQLVRRYADDKVLFDAITEAYMTLADPASRARYDESRGMAGRSQVASTPTEGVAPAHDDRESGSRCASCGAEILVGSRYCPECGLILRAPSQSPSRVRLGIGRLIVPDRPDPITCEGRSLTIGRHAACEVRIRDDLYVSSRHALLNGSMGIFTIEDLGSRNGVLVNNLRIAPRTAVALNDGDVITVGRTNLRFEIR